jgi:hypothetical protein
MFILGYLEEYIFVSKFILTVLDYRVCPPVAEKL